MKRRALLTHLRSSKWRLNFTTIILISFIVGSFFFMNVQFSGSLMHPSFPFKFNEQPKLAFLFIVRNRVPLEMVWDVFFQGVEKDRFSIYVHPRPGFFLNEATTQSGYFLNRQINQSVQVEWGEASMIVAERLLLKNALLDLHNERFIFLSDSCIPLYNFSYTYEYIMSTSTSFVDSFADTRERRYNPKMKNVIPASNWRKGSQWVILNRKHANIVSGDETIFQVFQKHCKRRTLPEYWRGRAHLLNVSKEHNCIPDEHYIQTLLAQKGLRREITRRTLTHTSWDQSASKITERSGWHPTAYTLSDVTPHLIRSIKRIDNINFETEGRREWCSSRGRPSGCFLFARKFTRPAALTLLNIV